MPDRAVVPAEPRRQRKQSAVQSNRVKAPPLVPTLEVLQPKQTVQSQWTKTQVSSPENASASVQFAKSAVKKNEDLLKAQQQRRGPTNEAARSRQLPQTGQAPGRQSAQNTPQSSVETVRKPQAGAPGTAKRVHPKNVKLVVQPREV